MPGDGVAVVEAAYSALASDGLDAFVSHWADDLDHRSVEGAPDDHGPIHGRGAFLSYIQDWTDMFEEFTIEPVELTEVGDRVVGALRFGGRARLSGVTTEQTFGVVFTIRAGKIARGREFATCDDARRAAACRGDARPGAL